MWYEFGQWMVRRADYRTNRVLFAVCLGFITAFFEAILDTWLTHHADKQWRLLLDAGSVGLLVALLSYIEVHALQSRRKRIEAEMRTVSELNHRVRNALQTIAYAVRLPETENQVGMIEDCVRRIDWTLRELFPSTRPGAQPNHDPDQVGNSQ